MKSFIFTLLFLLISINSYAADEWDKEELTLASIFTVATIIDWGQTRDIVKSKDKCTAHPDGSCTCIGYSETNLYLGKKPSISKIDTYMPLAIISTITLAHLLPERMRKNFLYGMSFLEIGTIYNNYKIGLKVNF